MITCIWCRKEHEPVKRYRCYKCGETLCGMQVEALSSILTQKEGVLSHASRSCGPVYDITFMSPVERITWFMRSIGEEIPVKNPRYVAKVTNGKSKT